MDGNREVNWELKPFKDGLPEGLSVVGPVLVKFKNEFLQLLVIRCQNLNQIELRTNQQLNS